MNGQTRRSRARWTQADEDARAARVAAAKAAEKRHMDHEVEHFLYRCYDADGTLLYIGCSMDPEARMNVHRSQWQNPASAYLNLHMTRYEVDETPHVGRIAGRAAEKAAIAAEAPLLNLHHNKGRGAQRVKVTLEDAREANRKLQDALDNLFKPQGGAA